MTQASEIGQILLGRSDDEIFAWVRAMGGADATLEQAFWGIKEAFQSERAAGQSALIRWDITTPRGDIVSYELEVADGECTLSRGALGEPLVVLSLDLADFLRLITGCLDATEAYRAGRLGITGDMAVAGVLPEWFKELH
ncbi:MAG: SCP2 sterol-binding domain-containing protein [Polyangiales bacterium]